MHKLIYIFIAIGVFNFTVAAIFSFLTGFSGGLGGGFADRERPHLPPWAIDKNPDMLPRWLLWLLSYIRRRRRSLSKQPPDDIQYTIITYRHIDEPFEGVAGITIENQIREPLQIPPFRP